MEVTGKLNDVDVTYIVKKPTPKDFADAKVYANKVASKILADKDEDGNPTVIFRSQLEDIRRKTGVWDDEKQERLDRIDEDIIKTTRKLTNGGRMTKKEGIDLALKVQKLRRDKFELLIASRELDELTLEATIENSNFNFLCSRCIFKEDGSNVFSSVDDYQDNNSSDVVVKCAAKLASMLYDLNENAEKELPENKFLIKHGIVDDNLRFVDKSGGFVSSDGRRVDKNGRYINDDGEFIDRDGNRVDEAGNLIGNETEIID